MSFLVRRWYRLVVLAVGLVMGLLTTAQAWTPLGFQTFPDGEAPVIVDPFCMSESCGVLPQEAWRERVLRAMAAWNTANTGFTFSEVAESFANTPCNEYDGISIILTDGEVCPGEPPIGRSTGQFLPTGRERARIYINLGTEHSLLAFETTDYFPTGTLIHEFGHAIGLGHPDEAGQEVVAIMNSSFSGDTLQPDDIAGARALYGGPGPLVGFLENPRAGAHQSGVGVISGWVCHADTVEIEINGVPYPVPYGTARLDTEDACGDVDNGFGLLFNWNLLGDGEHDVVAVVDGVELDRATITVTTLGEEFPEGLEGEYVLEGFPDPDTSVVLRWEESLQNFIIVERTP